MALAALWIAGRVLVLTPYAMPAAVVNAAFPAALAVAIGVPLYAGAQRAQLFLRRSSAVDRARCVLAVHLALQGRVELPSHRRACKLALDVVLFIMAVIGGRVMPMFTNNGMPGGACYAASAGGKVRAGRRVILLFVVDFCRLPPSVIAAIACVGALRTAHACICGSRGERLNTPLVWVLHAPTAGSSSISHCAACLRSDLVAASYAIHALTIGAIGGMTLGMMTRTARGHTGRPLVADRYEVVCSC